MEVKDIPQRLKPFSFESSCYGTAEAVPLQSCQILSFSEACEAGTHHGQVNLRIRNAMLDGTQQAEIDPCGYSRISESPESVAVKNERKGLYGRVLL